MTENFTFFKRETILRVLAGAKYVVGAHKLYNTLRQNESIEYVKCEDILPSLVRYMHFKQYKYTPHFIDAIVHYYFKCGPELVLRSLTSLQNVVDPNDLIILKNIEKLEEMTHVYSCFKEYKDDPDKRFLYPIRKYLQKQYETYDYNSLSDFLAKMKWSVDDLKEYLFGEKNHYFDLREPQSAQFDALFELYKPIGCMKHAHNEKFICDAMHLIYDRKH